MEVLEVELEEVYLGLHFVKNDLIVGVILSCCKDVGKEQLVQVSDLVHVGKKDVDLLFSDYFLF